MTRNKGCFFLFIQTSLTEIVETVWKILDPLLFGSGLVYCVKRPSVPGTRMHSSRMRTACTLTVSCGGGVLSPGGSARQVSGQRGWSAWGGCVCVCVCLEGVCPGGCLSFGAGGVCLSTCWDTTPPLWTEFLTHTSKNMLNTQDIKCNIMLTTTKP